MSRNRPLIRRARARDAAALTRIAQDATGDLALEITKQDLALRDVFVAKWRRRLVGFYAAGETDSMLEALIVAPDVRNQKIGRALLMHAATRSASPTLSIRCGASAGGFFRRFPGREVEGDGFSLFELNVVQIAPWLQQSHSLKARPWGVPFSQRPIEQAVLGSLMALAVGLIVFFLLVAPLPVALVALALIGGTTAAPLGYMWYRRVRPSERAQRQLEEAADLRETQEHQRKKLTAQRAQIKGNAGQLALTSSVEESGAVSLPKAGGELSESNKS